MWDVYYQFEMLESKVENYYIELVLYYVNNKLVKEDL